MKAKIGAMGIAAVLSACLLGGCGGGGSNAGQGTLRLVNATRDYGALDLYTGDTEELSAVAEAAASASISVDAAAYTVKLKPAGVSTTAATQALTVAGSTAYTVLAYNGSGNALATAVFTDNQSAPSSGQASVRIYNAGPSAGALDVYLVAPDADLSTAVASASLAASSIGSYIDFPVGDYRIRVTGAGDRSDVRLDVPALTLADRQVATLVLTAAKSGVLVDGLMVNQGGSVAAYHNAGARLRVVAAVTGNGTVAASTSDAVLATTLQAPSLGSYATVASTLPGFVLKVNGVAVDTGSLSLTAGSDYTLLVYGDAAAPQWRLLVDDNLPAAVSSNTKLRLVNLVTGLGGTLALNADFVAVADNVAYGTASSTASIAAGSSMRLEVTSPVRTTPLYLATDVALVAQKSYSLFVLGDAAAPVAVLRKDR